ncbi:MAG: tetratricopeptide repeat protein [Terriglobia bacterium]
MIVKNAEATLARCLESVRGIADEIVIADTGSTDRSIEIARQSGANVFTIVWERDFAKARNQSLAQVHSDWVLVLDADEILEPGAERKIPSLLKHPTIAGYVTPIRNYLMDINCHLWDQQAQPNVAAPFFAREYPAYVQHENVRLFRRHPDIRFAGRVHETVAYRLIELGMVMAPASIMIYHLGFIADAETLETKYVFYRELGREKVSEMPEDAMAHFELGIEEFQHFHNSEEAAKLFERACELNPRLGVSWLFLGLALARLGKHKKALESFEEAGETGARMALVIEGKADSRYSLGNFSAAREYYAKALKLPDASPQIESKLGFTEVRLGRNEQGLAHLRGAIKREPQNDDLHDRLVTACAWLGRLQEAAEAAEEKLSAVTPQPDFFLRAASLRAQLEEWPRVIQLLHQGVERFPESEKLVQSSAEAERRAAIGETETTGDERYQKGDFEGACAHYREALARVGNCPLIESKLGLAEVRTGQVDDGLARLRHALELEPKSVEVYDRLIGGCVLAGRLAEAADATESKLRQINPQPGFFLRAASLRAQLKDWPRVIHLLRAGLDLFPKDEKLLEAAAETAAAISSSPKAYL